MISRVPKPNKNPNKNPPKTPWKIAVKPVGFFWQDLRKRRGTVDTGKIGISTSLSPGCYSTLTKRARKHEPNHPELQRCEARTHRIHGTGIFPYIWLIFMVNVGIYTIHGSYGGWDMIAVVDVSEMMHQYIMYIYVQYPVIYKGFIHPGWCRISAINRSSKEGMVNQLLYQAFWGPPTIPEKIRPWCRSMLIFCACEKIVPLDLSKIKVW